MNRPKIPHSSLATDLFPSASVPLLTSQRIADASPFILYIYDLTTGKNVYSNRQLTDLLGYTLEEAQAMGENLLVLLVHPEDMPGMLVHLEDMRHLREGESREVEYRMRTKAGQWLWFNSHDTPFAFDEEGKVTQILGAALDIHERKETAEALRESEARLRDITATLPGLVYQFRVDKDGVMSFPFLSEGIDQIYEFSAEEGMKECTLLLDCIVPDQKDALIQSILDSHRDLTPWIYEYQIVQPGIEPRWLRGHALPRRMKDGSTLWNGVIADTTEQKRIEQENEELRRQQAHRILLESRINRLVHETPADLLCEEILQFTLEELDSPQGFVGMITEIGGLVFPAVTGETDFGSEVWKTILSDHKACIENETRMTSTGEALLSRSIGIPILYQGELLGVIYVKGRGEDYTKYDLERMETVVRLTAPLLASRLEIERRQRAEAQLKQVQEQLEQRVQERTTELNRREAHLRSVITGVPLIIFALDNFGVFTLSDGKGLAPLGLKPGQVVGKSTFDIYHEETEILDDIRRALAGETVVVMRELENFWFETLYSPAFDEAGVQQGVVGVSMDVGEKRRAEKALIHAKTSAEEANRAKTQFLANMSHELRTPMNAIIGFSEIMQDKAFGDLNAKQTRYTDNILSSARHLLQLINDILDLSKVEAGHLTLDYSLFDIQAAIRDVFAVVKPLVEKKRIRVKIECGSETLSIVADAGKCKQILYNLISNAIKFTQESGEIIVFSQLVRSSEEDERVEISVCDTGIGISPENQERIFTEFVQIDGSYARQQQGTGLGLALTRRLIELHGGSIAVQSEGENRGSTFVFRLPIRLPALNREESSVISPMGLTKPEQSAENSGRLFYKRKAS